MLLPTSLARASGSDVCYSNTDMVKLREYKLSCDKDKSQLQAFKEAYNQCMETEPCVESSGGEMFFMTLAVFVAGVFLGGSIK